MERDSNAARCCLTGHFTLPTGKTKDTCAIVGGEVTVTRTKSWSQRLLERSSVGAPSCGIIAFFPGVELDELPERCRESTAACSRDQSRMGERHCGTQEISQHIACAFVYRESMCICFRFVTVACFELARFVQGQFRRGDFEDGAAMWKAGRNTGRT